MHPPKPSLLSNLHHSSSRFTTTTRTRPPPPLSLLADRCSSMKQLLEVHAQMIVTGRIHDNYAASRLLSFCATHPSGDLLHASALLHHSPQPPNSFMWNTLIRGYAQSPQPADAIPVYLAMLTLGFAPGRHTFPFLLKACANCNALPMSRQLHAHVFKHGLDLDLYVANGLIRCYACGGSIFNARKVFDEMPERSLVVWTTMVSCCAQNSCPDEALALFDEMVEAGFEPNDATLASVLSACAKSGNLDRGERIHRYIKEWGVEMGVILSTALVDMYAKNGAIGEARGVFEGMLEKNTATWNAMICGLAHHGHANEALEMFKGMGMENVMPNDATFVGVLTACCHSGLVEVARELFYSMECDHGVEPKIEHYGCMVDLLGRCGRLEEAEELVKGMKWKADVVVLGALLAACKKHKNVAIGERVAEQILALEPCNHGVYVVLSNMYAEAGRWGDVARLRRVMRAARLKKIPGWSCVDDDDDDTDA